MLQMFLNLHTNYHIPLQCIIRELLSHGIIKYNIVMQMQQKAEIGFLCQN